MVGGPSSLTGWGAGQFYYNYFILGIEECVHHQYIIGIECQVDVVGIEAGKRRRKMIGR